MRAMSTLRTSRALAFALSLGVALGAAYVPGEGEAYAQRSRPLTKKERAKRKAEQEEAAKREQEKKDADAAAAAEEDEKKKKAAASSTPAASSATTAPVAETKEWDDTVEAQKAIYVQVDLGYTRPDLSTINLSPMGFDSGSSNGLLLGLAGRQRLLGLGVQVMRFV